MGTLINIDNGGTMTDICVVRDGTVFHAKTMTTPYDLSECFVKALEAGANEIFGKPDFERLLRETDHLRYSTTEGTNRIVEHSGPRMGLILSEGEDSAALQSSGAANAMFNVMVDDRVRCIAGTGEALESQVVHAANALMAAGANRLVVALSGDNDRADEEVVKDIILRRFPRHLLGALPVLFSYEMVNDRNLARRAWSGLLNGFLHPSMERFLYSSENVLRKRHVRKPMLIYCNDGTTKRVAKTVALKTLHSGPRGGLEGARALAAHYGLGQCITLDSGGTSADIAAVGEDGVAETRYGEVEGIAISVPIPRVHSIGAAGGSVMRVADGRITVGPDSVGSTPGPACFARGGTSATLTDAQLLLGLLDPDSYLGGTLKLDAERARDAVARNIAEPLGLSVEEALPRMVEAFEQAVADGVAETVGADDDATLLVFGGTGPMTACGIADRLGIKRVIVPRLAAVFSAHGIGFSDIAHRHEQPLEEMSETAVAAAREALLLEARRGMFAEGYDLDDCELTWHMAFDVANDGDSVALNGTLPTLPDGATNPVLLLDVHKAIPGSHWEVLDPDRRTFAAKADHERSLLQDGQPVNVRVYRLEGMSPGAEASGPAVLEESYFTAFVPPGWSFVADENLNIDLRAQT